MNIPEEVIDEHVALFYAGAEFDAVVVIAQWAFKEAAEAILNLDQNGATRGELEGRKSAVNAIATLPGAGDVFAWTDITGWSLADVKALFASDGRFSVESNGTLSLAEGDNTNE